jgi:hypothetical protein
MRSSCAISAAASTSSWWRRYIAATASISIFKRDTRSSGATRTPVRRLPPRLRLCGVPLPSSRFHMFRY